MNPYIIDPISDGRIFLPFQFEGVNESFLSSQLIGVFIDRVEFPKAHNLTTAWLVRIHFSNGVCLTISAASTDIGGWNDVGSLNIKLQPEIPLADGWKDTVVFNLRMMVRQVNQLCIDTEELFAQCGIEFVGDNGIFFQVVAGIAPGSLSLNGPFPEVDFRPEFPLSFYKRKTM